jgi:DNA-binding transcriptional regulator YiaG
LKKQDSRPFQPPLFSTGKTKRRRPPLSYALIELRQRLEETQQSLAQRLSVSVHSIALWETKNPPGGLMLLRLSKLAEEHGHEDLAKCFAAAVGDENRRIREMVEYEEELWETLYHKLYHIELEAHKLADAAARDRIIGLVRETEEYAAKAREGSWRNQR